MEAAASEEPEPRLDATSQAAESEESEPTLETASGGSGGAPPPGLRRVAMGSVWWNGLSFVSGKLLVLVSTIILARILSPKDFGLVALALVFITYADVLTDLGAA